MRIVGTATLPPGTGTRAVNVGVLLNSVEIIVCGKNGADTIGHASIGKYVDGGNARAVTFSADGSNAQSVAPLSGKIIQLKEKIGGVWTVVFEAEITPFSGTHVNLDVTVATASHLYTILIDGWT